MNGVGEMSKNRLILQGFDDHLALLREIGGSTDDAVSEALYVSAKIVADELARQINAVSVRPDGAWGTPAKPVYGLTRTQKRGLQESLGIAKFKTQGGIKNTKVGFDGYNDNDEPNSLVARGLNAGTSWLKKDRIIDRTIGLTKVKAEHAMQEVIEKKINELK